MSDINLLVTESWAKQWSDNRDTGGDESPLSKEKDTSEADEVSRMKRVLGMNDNNSSQLDKQLGPMGGLKTKFNTVQLSPDVDPVLTKKIRNVAAIKFNKIMGEKVL